MKLKVYVYINTEAISKSPVLFEHIRHIGEHK